MADVLMAMGDGRPSGCEGQGLVWEPRRPGITPRHTTHSPARCPRAPAPLSWLRVPGTDYQGETGGCPSPASMGVSWGGGPTWGLRAEHVDTSLDQKTPAPERGKRSRW